MFRVKGLSKAARLFGGVDDKRPEEVRASGIAAQSERQAQLADLPSVSFLLAESSARSDLEIEGCLIHVENVLQSKALQAYLLD